jgi:hypothetical protein
MTGTRHNSCGHDIMLDEPQQLVDVMLRST